MDGPAVSHIRPYVIGDVDAIVELCSEVVPALPNYAGMEVHAGRLRSVLENNVTNGMFLCLVLIDTDGAVVGGIAAWATPTIFSFEVICYDVFLYVDPHHRALRNVNSLIKGYVTWAQARKARLIKASNTGGTDLEPLLKRIGFVEVGKVYHFGEKR